MLSDFCYCDKMFCYLNNQVIKISNILLPFRPISRIFVLGGGTQKIIKFIKRLLLCIFVTFFDSDKERGFKPHSPLVTTLFSYVCFLELTIAAMLSLTWYHKRFYIFWLCQFNKHKYHINIVVCVRESGEDHRRFSEPQISFNDPL